MAVFNLLRMRFKLRCIIKMSNDHFWTKNFGHLCLFRPVYSALNFSFEDLPTSLQQNWLGHQILRTRFSINQLLTGQTWRVSFGLHILGVDIIRLGRIARIRKKKRFIFYSKLVKWRWFVPIFSSFYIKNLHIPPEFYFYRAWFAT